MAVAVGWSPDDSTVVTGGVQGKLLLWGTSDWRQLGVLPADTGWVLCVVFSPDGSLLAAGGIGERQVTLWDVASRKLVGRSLTREEWTELLPDRRYQPACR